MALAYTYIYRNPCEIVIPAGWWIDYVAPTAEARWRDTHSGDILAHEILHCLRGDWHSVYNQHRKEAKNAETDNATTGSNLPHLP